MARLRQARDGENITVGSFNPEGDPITQAKAQASWLPTLLKDMTGKDYPVRPVVVYPGWFVSRTNKDKGKDVWVLEPKNIPVPSDKRIREQS